ncbi:MAG TPA: YceI family protein [Acidimicrobiales bacterium]|nr:YceI family protein [Acidimicrobiales bacterium]
MSETIAPSPFESLREVDGQLLPVAGVWPIDGPHTSLAFEARHMVVTRMRGRFRKFSGEFHIAEVPEESWVEVTIDAASLDTTNDAADDSLKGERFLEVDKYPTLHFRSTKVRHVEANRWQVEGDLTIKGVSRPITLDAAFEGAVPAARHDKAKMAFQARGEFDRRDYGIDFNLPIPTGGWVVGNLVRIELDVEANLPA